MGKKKPKDAENNVKSNGSSSSGSSDVFKTLFGDITEQDASTSIFSNTNPFRRQLSNHTQTPQQLGLGFGSVEAIENPRNGDSENPDLVEPNKRKRTKEKKPNVDSASETPLDTKKSKKDEPENPNLGPRKNHNLGSESNGMSKKDKGKNPNLGFELNAMWKGDEGKTPNLGFESKGTANSEIEMEDRIDKGKEEEEKKKKKKKRKRDELEEEYEVRNYGAVAKAEGGGEGGLGQRVVGEKRKTVDNPSEMLVSKEGFDDESKLLRTVFVGNLPLKAKKKFLLKEFSEFGEIESVRIRSVPILDNKTPRKGAIIKGQINDSVNSVHAYIVFRTEQSAQASLAHNMAVVGGNHIRVDRACPPRKKLKGENDPLYDNKRTVFVGNLPFDVQDEEIYQLFCGISHMESSIEAVRVIRDPHTSVGKGIAYVLFKTRDAANLVIKKRNLKLRDRDLRLSHARSDSTPSKRKHPSSARTNYSPAKKLAVDSRTTPDSKNRVKTKAAISYQGLRASKSGVQKKVHPKIIEPMKLKSGARKGEKLKERMTKRPSVAARKSNALKGGGASKHAGKKRKLESQTPESSHRNKKAKKFR